MKIKQYIKLKIGGINMFNCRGEKCREEKVKEYEIIPLSHSKLLIGQQKKSCTGDILTDSYYLFEYKKKIDPSDTGGFYCGSHAAKHFLQLINHPGLPLFNPLSQLGVTNAQTVSSYSSVKKKWDPKAKELYDAINLLIICWDTPIYGALAKIKAGLEKFPDKEPFDKKILFVNNVIKKDARKRVLTQMLNDLRNLNPSLRQFTFNQLNAVLNSKNVDSYFEK